MPGFCVATLSSKVGWETKSPEEALALHFMYWFTSRKDQGKIIGDVPSFYYIWATYGDTPEIMVERTQPAFDSYIKELFPQSEVTVSKQTVDGQLNNYHLLIAAKAIYNGIVYDLSRAVLVTGQLYQVLDQKRLA